MIRCVTIGAMTAQGPVASLHPPTVDVGGRMVRGQLVEQYDKPKESRDD